MDRDHEAKIKSGRASRSTGLHPDTLFAVVAHARFHYGLATSEFLAVTKNLGGHAASPAYRGARVYSVNRTPEESTQ